MTAPAAATPAATQLAARKPSKKAEVAALCTAEATAGWPEWARVLAAVSAVPTGRVRRPPDCDREACGEDAGEPAGVQGGVDAADHSHTEGAAQQAGGVVDRRADPGLGLGHRSHDGLGGGRAGETHARPQHNHLSGDGPVAGACRRCGHPHVEDGHRGQSCGHDQLGAEPYGELGAYDRCEGDTGGDRQEANTGRQRTVVLDELEVLGDQEDEPGQGEEGDGH